MRIRFTAYEKQLASLREQVASIDDLKAEIAELRAAACAGCGAHEITVRGRKPQWRT